MTTTSINFKNKNFIKNIVKKDKVIVETSLSDTLNTLYDHRNTLYIALCRTLSKHLNHYIWRSKKHSDKKTEDGWFILGINESKGIQMTYHLPISKWKETSFAQTLPFAPEWDKHTSADVLMRLKKL